MNPPPSNILRLSTAQFAERDRIEASREVIGRSLMKMQFELRPDVPFHIDMVFRGLPDFALATGNCSAMDCLRTPDLIDSDDLVLTVALSGGCILHVRGEEIPVGEGTAALMRTTDVARCAILSTSDLVNFRFPFARMAPLIDDLDAALIRPIPIETEAMRLLMHYVGALESEETLASPEIQSLVSAHLQDLAAIAVGATRDAAMVGSGRGVPATRLRAIKADVVKNLTDRRLSIDIIAARHGITPRYVSMLFDGDATTFTEFVLLQRLNRAYRMLSHARFSELTVSAIAFEVGFGDLSYFNRVFRRRYGVTPSDVRQSARRDSDGDRD